MAWTEQCKIAFRMNALGKLSKYKNKNRKVSGVLKKLASESGIPVSTLKKWYYDKPDESISTKNGPDRDIPIEIPICNRCNKKPVHLTKMGNPMSEDSKFYGLCNSCRRNQQYIEVIDREATDSNKGLMTVCPHCEKPHYMNVEFKPDRTKGVDYARDTT